MADQRIIRTIYFSVGLLLFSISTLFAQSGSNPFDLKHRLNQQQSSDTLIGVEQSNPFDLESRVNSEDTDTQTATPESTPPPNATPVNPFDIRRPGTAVSIPPPVVLPQSAERTSDELVQEQSRGGFMFWSLLVLMVFLALMVTLYRSLLGKIYRAFSNENILKLLQREQGGIVNPPYWFLYALYFASAGIFVFQLARYYNFIPHQFRYLAFSVTGVAIFFLVKHILLKFMEGIFPVSKTIKQYSFTIVVFNIILGILLIPVNIFIAFAQDKLTSTGVILGLLAVLAVYLFRLLRSAMISTKYLAFHKFHFFMYLCTIEIAPMLIIIKLIINGANIQ